MKMRNNLFRVGQWIAVLMLLSSCDFYKSKNSSFEPLLNLSRDVATDRYKVVGLKGTYGQVSSDILVDTATGESWQMYWSGGDKNPLTGENMGKYLWWKKIAKDDDSALDDYTFYLKLKMDLEKNKSEDSAKKDTTIEGEKPPPDKDKGSHPRRTK